MLSEVRPITHEQTNPAAEWVIDHNFGREPAVDVFISVNGIMTKVMPYDVQVMSANRVKIIFTSPRAGKARLV